MREGVTIVDPASTYIDKGVTIGKDTIIYPNCIIQGHTVIGENCTIESGVTIIDSKTGSEVVVKSCSVITKCTIGNRVSIGPFAHLRPETHLEERVKIGNFVEVKKSRIGKGSKASHLSYIGDTTMGEGVNVGAGTITCNYDGEKKHHTHIEDRVFIGSDTQFIAPVRIGKDSVIGAGSTITRSVPPFSLAVSRARQVNYKRVFIKRGEKKK
jgi:bifunctional UDP-N-acetylglucosamine pyrophosphorylase/glucosamine-1-phosphate N-acetyltransferase